MYTNIDTNHAITSLKEWLTRHKSELPRGFPTEMVIRAAELVMTNNIIQFDDTFWLQEIGTAMGTNSACSWASIYYANKEETTLLPLLQGPDPNSRNDDSTALTIRTTSVLAPRPPPPPLPLLFYGRLIDDT